MRLYAEKVDTKKRIFVGLKCDTCGVEAPLGDLVNWVKYVVGKPGEWNEYHHCPHCSMYKS